MITEITDDDISWAEGLLGLRPLDEQRRDFVKSLETVDAAACPGSGKTTLAVAKLAILARKWKDSNRGVCVLSHTNVAREEIERRLGHTSVGQALLHYPHCIDTIHSFASKFLATPYLRSVGRRVTAIDDDMAIRARRRHLNQRDFSTLTTFLNRKHLAFEGLRLRALDENAPLGTFNFAWGAHTDTYRLAANAVWKAAEDGYYCYDEIFFLAEKLLEAHPSVPEILRQRFPLVIIDEMQDTSEQQGRLLQTVFPRDADSAIIQRVGDPNQAIFEGGELFTTDRFPDAARCIHIADSHRFDSSIAGLANPFANVPIQPDGLRGVRDQGGTTIPHHIFVFPDGIVTGVLGAFGQHLISHFSQTELQKSTIAALGSVHKTFDEDVPPAQFPKSVCHYWNEYSPHSDKKDPSPTNLAAYFHSARNLADNSSTLASSVDQVARGIVHFSNLTAGRTILQPTSRPNVQLTKALVGHPAEAASLQKIVARFVVNTEPLNADAWESISDDLNAIATALAGCNPTTEPAESFMEWEPPATEAATLPNTPGINPNTFRHSVGQDHVDIKLSSIHRAKGQTHLATLVLETFNYSHFLKSLLPWLTGAKSGGQDCRNDREIKRLLQMYVAVTRPTHLLCLAIMQSTLGEGRNFDQNCERLRQRGWTIQIL